MSTAYEHTLGASVGIGFVRMAGKELAVALEQAMWGSKLHWFVIESEHRSLLTTIRRERVRVKLAT